MQSQLVDRALGNNEQLLILNRECDMSYIILAKEIFEKISQAAVTINGFYQTLKNIKDASLHIIETAADFISITNKLASTIHKLIVDNGNNYNDSSFLPVLNNTSNSNHADEALNDLVVHQIGENIDYAVIA